MRNKTDAQTPTARNERLFYILNTLDFINSLLNVFYFLNRSIISKPLVKIKQTKNQLLCTLKELNMIQTNFIV